METEALALPLDITWQRLGYSRDMIDTNFGDFNLPPKWRSSVVVYSYVVPEEQTAESYPDSRIVYLKLSCSITGFNISEELIDPSEIDEVEDELDDLQSSTWESIQSQGWANRYWPCMGAIAQIAIYPSREDDAGPDDFPFIQDFEPKKRELLETRTESGEMLSASSEKINVKKGTTTTNSTEKTHIASGEVGLDFKIGPVGIKPKGGYQYSHKKSEDKESMDITTTDASTEKRESTSFSTTFSQMYQLFNGYHLGTNRAVFIISPRPHTVTGSDGVDFNLIEGQRKLEGVQDMFLVVVVPKKLKGICIQANLDTGHQVARENGVILKMIDETDPTGDTGGGGPTIPPPPPDDDDDFPDLPELPEGSDEIANPFSSRLVVTRRIIRNCGLFNDSNQLDIVGADSPLDESENIIVHEDPVAIGRLEKDLIKSAENQFEAKNLIANQRNRFQRRVVNSMLSGFTSSRYKPKPVTQTKAFSDLTQLALKSNNIDVNSPALKKILSQQEIKLLRQLEIDKVGRIFDRKMDRIPGVYRSQLDEIRKKIEQHVLKPTKGNSGY